MRELTKQEISYRDKKCRELGQINIDTVIGFDNGFIAGLDYQQEQFQEKIAVLVAASENAIRRLQEVERHDGWNNQMWIDDLKRAIGEETT